MFLQINMLCLPPARSFVGPIPDVEHNIESVCPKCAGTDD